MLEIEQLHSADESAAKGHGNLDLDAVSPHEEAGALAVLLFCFCM